MPKAPAKAPMRPEVLASLGVAWGGVVWGLFWLPLRGLAGLGVSPQWAVAVFFLLPALLVLPLLAWRALPMARMGAGAQATAAISAFAMALYAAGVLHTDVIRAILFFYLTPLWSTLLGWLLLHEKIGPARHAAMALAFLGLGVMVGGDGLSMSLRSGDVMALLAGLIWAYAAVRLRRSSDKNPLDIALSYTLWGAPMALLVLSLPPAFASLPEAEALLAAAPWLVPFAALLMIPAAFTSLYGARHLSPGLVGILFMTEIVVGAITAAIWAGEPLGLREGAGIALILSAACLETASQLKGPVQPSPASSRGQGRQTDRQ